METVLLDEIIEKVISHKPEERQKEIRALQEEERKTKPNGGKVYVSPDTVWEREISRNIRECTLLLKTVN